MDTKKHDVHTYLEICFFSILGPREHHDNPYTEIFHCLCFVFFSWMVPHTAHPKVANFKHTGLDKTQGIIPCRIVGLIFQEVTNDKSRLLWSAGPIWPANFMSQDLIPFPSSKFPIRDTPFFLVQTQTIPEPK